MAQPQKPQAGAGMQDGAKTPLQPSMIQRAIQGVKYMLTGNVDEWMGPGQPVAPQAQNLEGVAGRQFDFRVSHNIQRNPRDGEGATFAQMRALADGYDLLRLVIETRKDQMCKLAWNFALKPDIAKAKKAQEQYETAMAEFKKPPPEPPEPNEDGTPGMPPPPEKEEPKPPETEDPRITQLKTFFAFPDGEHDWDTWLRMILEDMLVCDAATIYPRPTLAGDLYALEPVDGTTIKRLLDAGGRTPEPPQPAYQQILKGVPAVDYSRDELIYRPRNVRTNKVYGYSPVEQIIMTVNIALRRQVHQLQYYTEGNVPEALIGVPPEWNPDQIARFQELWDGMLEGNTAERRHAKFVPGGMNVTMLKEAVLKDGYDEWLARIICFAYSISPQALIQSMNRATAQTAQDQALQEGLMPIMKWVKSLLDYIIQKYFGFTDLEFKWEEEDESGPKEQMDVLTGYVKANVMTDDEARAKLGLDPLTPAQRAAIKPPTPPGFGFGGGSPDDSGKNGPNDNQAKGSTEKPVGKLFTPLLAKGFKPLSRQRRAVRRSVSAMKKILNPALTAMGERLAKELADAAVGKAVNVDTTAARLISELTFEELEDIAPELAEVIREMATEGGKDAIVQVLGAIDKDQLAQVNEKALAYAKDRSAELVTSLTESTRDMLRSTLAEGIENGWSNDELADALEDTYAFSPERSETIARTETAYADVQGNLDGYRESGVVEGKQWIIGQDEFCDDCQELDGVIVGLDENFPGDGGDGPPLHPNCRCDILPVLSQEDN